MPERKRRILTIRLTSHLLRSLFLFIIWVLYMHIHLSTHPPVDCPSLFHSHHDICSLMIKLKVNSIENKPRGEIFLFMINSLVYFFCSCFSSHFYVLVDSLTAVKRILKREREKKKNEEVGSMIISFVRLEFIYIHVILTTFYSHRY